MRFNKSMAMVACLAGMLMAGCSGGGGTDEGAAPKNGAAAGGEKPLVVFAQANSQDPWRQVFDANIKGEADKHASDFSYEQQDAQDDPNKQIDEIETFLVKNPKVLLVSAADTSVTQVCEKAFDKGISVIVLDRDIESEKFTCYVGGDNMEIGRQVGEYMGKTMGGKGTILMIQGKAGAKPTEHRRDGFLEVMKAKFPGISIIVGDNADYQRQKARAYMETFLQSGKTFDAVYAHNDEMAIGAYLALEAKGIKGKMIVGVDGCQAEVLDYIREGKMAATFKYPTPGEKGIEIAAEILKGNAPKEKKIILPTTLVTKETADKYLADNPHLFRAEAK